MFVENEMNDMVEWTGEYRRLLLLVFIKEEKEKKKTTIDCHFGWAMNIDHLFVWTYERGKKTKVYAIFPIIQMTIQLYSIWIERKKKAILYDLHDWIQTWILMF